jgi:4a-hydroxytetrahydrobiopterin dehydratase
VLTLEQLLAAHCRPLEGQPMPPAAVSEQLRVLPEWRFEHGALCRSYRFADYYRTIAFVNALAFMVHREDHHPDLAVGYNRCEVRFNTHSVNGVSANDFICAAKADAIFAQRDGGSAA